MTREPGTGPHVPTGYLLGTRCEESGTTMLWHGPPLGEAAPSGEPGVPAPCPPCLAADIFELRSPHRCTGTTYVQALARALALSGPRPCPCACRSRRRTAEEL
ncbi:hypothetical protein [Streptomyces sp. NPDC088258]|uniref:hypothetical protein n=1 Tax=Streptomyces sp. NPDC088258 TaxID=3365849 RepID=UPI00381F7877